MELKTKNGATLPPLHKDKPNQTMPAIGCSDNDAVEER